MRAHEYMNGGEGEMGRKLSAAIRPLLHFCPLPSGTPLAKNAQNIQGSSAKLQVTPNPVEVNRCWN